MSMTTKRTFIRRAYKAIQPLTCGIHRDDCWSGVKEVVKAIISVDKGVTLYLESAGYHGVLGEAGCCKKYHYTVVGCEKNIDLQIVASFCGTIKDPMSAYDLTVLMN